MPKNRREGAGFLSTSEKQKLQKLYSEGPAAFGSVKNLTKASKLPVSKVQYFLHSKFSYTRLNQATGKLRRTRAFARFKNEIWCMDLAFVHKLAKDNNAVNCLLVRQRMFDRMVDAKGMKTKDSEETVKIFFKMITKKNRPKKVWVDQGTEFALPDISKSSVLLREYMFTPQGVKQRQPLQREQSGCSKITYTDLWRNMDTNIFTDCLNLSTY